MRSTSTASERVARDPDLVSVIIPAHNAEGSLAEQLDALEAQSYARPVEIIVVDNRSTDGTQALAATRKAALPGLRIVAATAGAGPAYARNAGARAADGDLLAFCDADDVVDPHWLDALVAAAAGADAVAGSIDHDSLNDPVTRAWRSPIQVDELPVLGDYLPYAMTANCAIWTDVFRSLDGFDEGFGRASEDVDFFWRLQLGGFKFVFEPGATVRYRHRADIRLLVRQHYEYGQAEAFCFRKYRDAGMPPRSVRRSLRDWRNMLRRAPEMLRDETQRGVWLRLVAYRAGYVTGSLRAGVLYV